MSRRRPRIDIEGCQDTAAGIPDAQFLEELEHMQTCPILRYIQREPRVIENDCSVPGWKKVVLPGMNDSSLLTYYWHVESGRLSRDCPKSTIDAMETPKAQLLKITESLKEDAIFLAQECVPHEVRIHAAVLAQIAEALYQECEASEESAWSSIARVLKEQRKSIKSLSSDIARD